MLSGDQKWLEGICYGRRTVGLAPSKNFWIITWLFEKGSLQCDNGERQGALRRAFAGQACLRSFPESRGYSYG